MKIIKGTVIKGRGRGRGLGFPTANISLDESVESGVYSGKVNVSGKEYIGAIFISLDGKMLEAHILDFSGNIYGQVIEVELNKKIRDVIKFNNDGELKDQIKKDLELIRKI